jgi:hypothetical protein
MLKRKTKSKSTYLWDESRQGNRKQLSTKDGSKKRQQLKTLAQLYDSGSLEAVPYNYLDDFWEQ